MDRGDKIGVGILGALVIAAITFMVSSISSCSDRMTQLRVEARQQDDRESSRKTEVAKACIARGMTYNNGDCLAAAPR